MINIMKSYRFKSICTFILAMIMMILPITSTVYAVNSEEISISDNKMVFELTKLGFTKGEIYDLYEMEANRLNSSIELPDLLKGEFGEYVYPEISVLALPSNPRPGTYYDVYFDINYKSLAEDLLALGAVGSLANIPELIGRAPKALLTKALLKYIGIGAIATAGIGGIIFLVDKYLFDAEGVRGYQTWYYGEDNHGGISWTPGYIDGTPYY